MSVTVEYALDLRLYREQWLRITNIKARAKTNHTLLELRNQGR